MTTRFVRLTALSTASGSGSDVAAAEIYLRGAPDVAPIGIRCRQGGRLEHESGGRRPVGADDRLPPGSGGGGAAAQQRNVGVVGRPGPELRDERPRRLDPDRHLEPDHRGGQRRHGHQHGPQHVLSRCGRLAQWGRHGHRRSQRPTDQHLRPDDELVERGAANEHRPRLPGHDLAVERTGVHPRWFVVGRARQRTQRKTGRGVVAHRRLAGADRCPGDTDVHRGCPGGLPGRQRRVVHRHLRRQGPPGRALEADELDHHHRHGQHHPGRDCEATAQTP